MNHRNIGIRPYTYGVCAYVCTVDMYVCTYICTYVCTYVCMYVCMYVRTICACVNACISYIVRSHAIIEPQTTWLWAISRLLVWPVTLTHTEPHPIRTYNGCVLEWLWPPTSQAVTPLHIHLRLFMHCELIPSEPLTDVLGQGIPHHLERYTVPVFPKRRNELSFASTGVAQLFLNDVLLEFHVAYNVFRTNEIFDRRG